MRWIPGIIRRGARMMHTDNAPPLLELRHVSIRDRKSGKMLVHDISFSLQPGHCLGIVGESGSGKTLLCRALMGLLPPALTAEGQACFDGTDMLHVSERLGRRQRGSGMSAILQQAMTVFDPLYTIGAQLTETLCDKRKLKRKQAHVEASTALAKVNLPASVLTCYPHQLSGGMLQRCMIALSLALQSRLVVADEPTASLDAHNQYAILQRLVEMRNAYRTTLIFVSHDLGAVQMLADRLLVLQRGVCVEQGRAAEIFQHPRHEYTRHLVRTRLMVTRAFQRLMGDKYAAAR